MIQYKLFNKTSNVYLRHVYPQDKLQRALIYSANNIQEIFDYRTLLLHDTQLAGSILEIHEFNGSEFIRIVEPEDAIASSTIDSIIAKHLNKHAGTVPIPVSNLICCIKAIIVEYNASISPKITIPSDLDVVMLENYRLQNELLHLQISVAKLPSSLKFDATTVSEEDLDKIRKSFSTDTILHPILNYPAGRDEYNPFIERVYRKGNILHLVFEEEPCYKVDDKSGIKPELMKHDYVIELDADHTASDIIALIKKKATEWTAPNSRVTLMFSNIL